MRRCFRLLAAKRDGQVFHGSIKVQVSAIAVEQIDYVFPQAKIAFEKVDCIFAQ